MSKPAFPTFYRGLSKIRDNPQLIYSILIALLITGAFIFMAERFIGIANDAQERLINVRIGSLQDSFVAFARDNVEDGVYLNEKISEVIRNNETIKNFKVVKKIGSEYFIRASNDTSEIGNVDPKAGFLYSFAATHPDESVTMEIYVDGERLFNTARAIVSPAGEIDAVVISTQTLSLADLNIERSISDSITLLVLLLTFIMFLFLRHAKIIDYAVLYRKLKEVDQLKDDFVSMASHELRTPLTIIRGYVDHIRSVENLPKEVNDYASKIDTGAKELDMLVADILDVNKIEQGRMSFSYEELNPTELARTVTDNFREVAKGKNLELTFENDVSDSARIYVDKDRLKQILVNLVSNAIKYTLKGEVKVKEYIDGDNLVFRISDSGVGISAEEQKKLFEKFHRIRREETKEVRGTGLGLWITARIIKEMKGTVSVESIKDVGSHFVVSFPLIKTKG